MPRIAGVVRRDQRYHLLERLARGGMGEVYLAVATGAGGAAKLVVVKRVLESLADDPEFVEMFLNEARLAATLDHPNIVRVYDVVDIDARSSIVMEYIHGVSLGVLLHAAKRADSALPLDAAVAIVDRVAAALEHAHEATTLDGRELSIVHRDVSPNNIVIGYGGEVKLIDFGIARAMAATRITRGDVLKGKVAYMAPEQCTGGAIGRHTDLFALGIVLYEATTMRRAFRTDNDMLTMNRIVSGTVTPPSQLVPDYPPMLEEVVMRCLEVDPAARFGSTQEFRAALGEVVRRLGFELGAVDLGDVVRRTVGDKPFPRVDSRVLQRRRAAPRAGRTVLAAFGAGVLVAAGVSAVLISELSTPANAEVSATPSIPARDSPEQHPPERGTLEDPPGQDMAARESAKPQPRPETGPTPDASATPPTTEPSEATVSPDDPPAVPRRRAGKRSHKSSRKPPAPSGSTSDKPARKIPRGLDGVLPGSSQ